MALFKTETRIQIIGLIFLAAICGVLAKLWWVQVACGAFYAEKVRGNSQVTVRIPSVRGEIRDRNGIPLVTNRASYEVDFYLPEMVQGYKQAFGAKNVPMHDYRFTLKGTLQTRPEVDIDSIVQDTVQQRLEELGINEEYNTTSLQVHYRNDTLVPFTFMEDIKFEDMAKLSEHDLGVPGVQVTRRPVRQYLFGSLAAHILGYVGPVDTDKPEIKEDAKNYTFYQADVEGKNNIEASMDQYLRGKPGVRYVKKNAKGVIEGDLGSTAPVPGDNVYLTIDARIQSIAENALRVAGRGAAVVVNPWNGDVLAMVSVPSFDPNRFIPSISGKDWNRLIKDETNPLTNRAILSYAPGSTFKTVTALAGLRKGIGNRHYTCTGGVTYGNKYMKCWIASLGGSHGDQSLTDAIKNSCNAFFYQFGNAAGIDQIDAIGKMLGMGEKTGIELTNEAPGILPGPDWLAHNLPKEKWSQGFTANASIGQGYVQASPLQMALDAATLANGGTCYYPRLIDKVVDQNGKEVLDEDGQPAARPPRVRTNLIEHGLTPQLVEQVRKGMWRVVNEAGGTAGRAKLKSTEVAGKTGTAQFWRNGQKDNHTWFICFAPYAKPKYAVCVFLQGAKAGGTTAAPIAARILEESLAMDQGYKPELVSLPPAVGNFTFIQNIDFTSKEPASYAASQQPPPPNEEDSPAGDQPEPPDSNKNGDRDRQAIARPNVRADPDSNGSRSRARASASPEPQQPGSDASPTPAHPNNFLRSMRHFFGHGGGDDNAPTDDQTVKQQQKSLSKQRDQQRQERSPQPASQQPPPQQQAPKRKKFMGIF